VVRVPTPWVDNEQPVTLEMVVYRPLPPPAQGTASPAATWPTLVFNHGSTGRGDKPDWFKHTWVGAEVGKYFVAKGWQVVFPQRRGRGASGGLYDEGFEPDRSRYSCRQEPALAGFERAVADLDAVMDHLRRQPDVDMQRLLVGGVSRGGMLSVAYGGQYPGLFRGVLNFVGGWVGDVCRDATHINTTLSRRGAAMTQPMLWLYGEADPYYRISHSRGNFEAFTAAGGQGQFLTFEVHSGGRDGGHGLHSHPSLWQPVVERYLSQQVLN
jgi:pimeloyl-ACP methyl ester carboxylesterase